MEVYIYTNSRCANHNGSYSAMLMCGDKRKMISGGFHNTTNQRMELLSALHAIEHIKKPCSVTIVANPYVADNFHRIDIWKSRNWKKTSGGAVSNIDLWTALQEEVAKRGIEIKFQKTETAASNPELPKMTDEEVYYMGKAVEGIMINLGMEDFIAR